MTKFKKILLVEDDPITILVCDRILKMTGFGETIVSKTNGQEAINYLHTLIELNEPLPEVIFLDINMPIMNGWDFLNEFKLIGTQLIKIPKMYILSSTADPEDTKKAHSYDCVIGSISKPLKKEHLDAIF
jgi:CheY-like chemotaxis protein